MKDPIETLLQQGIVDLQSEEYLKAFLCFERALAQQPGHALLWVWRGQALREMSHGYLTAHRDRLPPEYGEHWIAERDVWIWNPACNQAALASFDRALEIAPDRPEFWQARAECLLGQGISSNNDEDKRTHLYLEALSSIEQAIALAPTDPALWKTHVTVLEKLRRFDQARQSIEYTLKLVPTDYTAWNTYGYLLLWYLDCPQEALEAYDRALSLTPEADSKQLLRTYRGRGIALEELGQDAKALESYDRSLEFGGNDSRRRAQKLRQKLDLASQERAIQANPEDWEAWYAKAKQFVAQESYTSAIPCYDRILEINPNLPEILQERGIALVWVGRYAAAIADFDRLIEQYPDNREIWYLKANALCKGEHYAAAIALYDRPIDLDPNHPAICDRGNALWELDRFEEAIAVWDLALNHPFLAKERYQRQEIWYKRGLAMINLERYEEAFFCHHHDSAYYSPKLKNPDDDRIQLELQDAENWFYWGKHFICAELGHYNYREVGLIMQKAIALDPNLYPAFSLYAYAMLRLKRYTESVDYYERVLAMDAATAEDDRDFARDWHNLAIAQMKLEQYEAAIVSCDRALAITPEDLHILTHRGNALRYAERYDEAIAAYDLVISLKPAYQPVFYYKAVVYALQGNTEPALESLREGVRLLTTGQASGSVSNIAIASTQEPAFDRVRSHPEFQALMQAAQAGYQKIFGTPAGFYPAYP